MNPDDLSRTIRTVSSALSSLGVPFHLTGGLASSYYGEPRLTRDAEFVVRLTRAAGKRLIAELEAEFLIEGLAVLEAIGSRGLFQALHKETLIKADFHVGERIEGELDRSVVREIFDGLRIPVVSKEDAILSKLIWVREGSEKSRGDVIGMLLDPMPVDIGFIRDRAQRLGCGQLLEEAEREAATYGPNDRDS